MPFFDQVFVPQITNVHTTHPQVLCQIRLTNEAPLF